MCKCAEGGAGAEKRDRTGRSKTRLSQSTRPSLPFIHSYEIVRPKPARRLAEEAGLAVASSLALVSLIEEEAPEASTFAYSS